MPVWKARSGSQAAQGNEAYNATTGVYEDRVKASVVDLKKVTREALQMPPRLRGG
jgi:chaperonin GroEL (HSP60 family)